MVSGLAGSVLAYTAANRVTGTASLVTLAVGVCLSFAIGAIIEESL